MNTECVFIIADNQDISRKGMHGYISELFSEYPIADVKNRQELLTQLTMCDGQAIVILDYTLFDLNGIEGLLIICKRFSNTRWILFSNELSEIFIRKLSSENNISMVMKEASEEEIRMALTDNANHGKRFLCHQISNLLSSRLDSKETHAALTTTETEILRMIALGKSVKEIAWERVSSIHTITTHKKNIFRKLGVNCAYEATKYALRAGLVEIAEYYI